MKSWSNSKIDLIQSFQKNRRLLFVASMLLVMGVAYRFPSLTANANHLNPDEAEMLAMANSVELPGLGKGYSTSTFGPILPYVIKILQLFGLPNSFAGLHILQLILLLLIFLLVSNAGLKLIDSKKMQNFFLFFQVLIFSSLIFAESTDFLSLTSETLPILFCALTFNFSTSKASWGFFLAGFFSGLVAFTKLQVLPLSIVLLIIGNSIIGKEIFENRNHIKKRLIASCFGVLFSTMTCLYSLSSSGELDTWYTNSFTFSWKYATTDLGNNLSGGKSTNEKLLGAVRLIGSDVFLTSMVIILISTISWLLCVYSISNKLKRLCNANRKTIYRSVWGQTLIWFTAIFSIALPGNMFPHYLLIVYFTLSVSLISVIVTLVSINRSSQGQRDTPSIQRDLMAPTSEFFKTKVLNLFFLFSMLCLLFFNLQLDRGESYLNSFRVVHYSDIDSGLRDSVSSLNRVCPKGSTVLVWGWGSEVYHYARWKPTPYFINDATRLIAKIDDKSTDFRLKELLENRIPDCILSANGSIFSSNLFKYKNSIQEYDPYLTRLLKSSYRSVLIDSKFGELWVKNFQQSNR